jgi:hypothetical protein
MHVDSANVIGNAHEMDEGDVMVETHGDEKSNIHQEFFNLTILEQHEEKSHQSEEQLRDSSPSPLTKMNTRKRHYRKDKD